jgi:glycosyltransferase involved in cell wall biosynthesis
LLEGENFDWIITSSPPESLHYAGYKLKGVLANHWHADMRDYWLKYPLIDIRNNHIRRARESRIAKKWLKRADLRTAVDSGMASEMESLSGCQTRILPHFSLPNFESKTSVNFEGPVKSVRLVYTGSFTLSDSNRHIEPMLQTYEKAFKTRKNLTLHIFGRLTQHEVQAIKTSRASSSIFFYGAVSAEKALSAQKNADALVITASKKASAVPGKLMEYRHTNKPIIAIGDGPWLSANPDIKQGEEAMILASKKELPVSNVKTINLQGVCDTLIKFLRDENSNNHPL